MSLNSITFKWHWIRRQSTLRDIASRFVFFWMLSVPKQPTLGWSLTCNERQNNLPDGRVRAYDDISPGTSETINIIVHMIESNNGVTWTFPDYSATMQSTSLTYISPLPPSPFLQIDQHCSDQTHCVANRFGVVLFCMALLSCFLMFWTQPKEHHMCQEMMQYWKMSEEP